jgi:hypothetical protein
MAVTSCGPTVLTKTRPEMKVVREEIFGPVVCAQPIIDDDIARQANSTTGRYGLDQLPQCLRRIPSLRRLQGVRLGA